ncbi:phosphatidylinositol-specific phospholipase C [Mammaliicoccus stepanovicii]|uniref:1-phosphatidylinositol phosphodiesterase n=1 Tax=Mammaliicoccus stepanovicii TaxID=643214 RepID=A0A239ZFJ9_9STAP|nr:phosphatidylinositol-specific phospholipase C [Mammaliicoccus stepanovicii]PNZ71780.1 1-phosphatidylinositol phosphodiesterase [Mammaliicoccus stepanovicii]GGI41936.1 1-phosphatidylinositol phosphodiesterase [Mammaliicoccus stepanovicii]SNV69697.1 Phosphatidylinositol-specific phospholipase C [Mammaliicoccus stepanovicii]
MKTCYKILVFLTILLVVNSYNQSAYAQEPLSASPENWMSKIDENKHLTQINIPGTHDSGSFTLSDPTKSVWAKTQDKNYLLQMKEGVRFFDIRGRASSNDSISIHHGVVYLHHELGSFLNDANHYLGAYPNETIVMSIKKDHKDDESVTKSFEEIFREKYFNNPQYENLFYKGNNSNPTLKETKGKIVLLNRMGGTYIKSGYGADTSGIRWPDNSTFETDISNNNIHLNVQDEYKDYYDDKVSAVKNLLNKSKSDNRENSLYLNFLSVSSGGTAFNSIYAYASHINPEIAKTIKENGKSRTGWVIVDYAGYKWSGYDDIVNEVINSNN